MHTSNQDQDRHRQDDHRHPAISPWEWAVAALGLALVLGAIGYIAYYALAHDSKVPAITVERVETVGGSGGYIIRIRATNHASITAASLTITGELREGDRVVETRELTLDYLPPFSERQAGLIFQQDPSEYELRLIPGSYDEP